MTALLLAIIAAAPSPQHALLEKAKQASEAGQKDEAIALATQIITKARKGAKTPVPVHRGAQDILLKAGKSYDLIIHYDNILRGDISDPRRRYLRARVEPDPVKRRRELEGVLLSSKNMFWATYDLAEAYALEGSWARAVQHARRATQIKPDEAAAWNVLGHLQLESARHHRSPAERKDQGLEARAALGKAIELDPNLVEAHYNLGLVNYVLGDKQKARAAWRKAVAVRPTFAEALNSLGHLEARDGKLDEAIALYTKAVSARNGYGTAHNNLSVAYYRKNDLARARKHLALAEAAGHNVAPSYKRVLTRAIEEAAFVEFQKALARSKRRAVEIRKPQDDEAIQLSESERRSLMTGILKAAFRNSHGGVRVAPAGSTSGGERRVGDTPVARYAVAATIVVSLDEGEKLELVAVLREAHSSRKRELDTWIADAGRRFSANAPEMAAILAPKLGLPLRSE